MSLDSNPPKKGFSLRKPSLTEVVGVAALVIAGLGYWDSHRERVQQDQQRAAAEHAQAAAEAAKGKVLAQQAQQEAIRHALLLTGVPAAGELRLQSSRPDQVIQTQTLWFPAEVRDGSVATTGNPRIEARWVEDRLRRLARRGDHQMPVAIETSFIEDGQSRTDRLQPAWPAGRRPEGGVRGAVPEPARRLRRPPGRRQRSVDRPKLRFSLRYRPSGLLERGLDSLR